MIMVTTVNVTDWNGAIDMVDYYCDVTNRLSMLKKVLVDGGYTGENFANAINALSGATDNPYQEDENSVDWGCTYWYDLTYYVK